MTYEIDIRVLPEQPTAVVRGTMPVADMSTWLPAAYQEIGGYLQRCGAAPAGPPFARYTFRDDLADVEAGFPVTRPVGGAGRVVPSSLPSGPAAVTTHHGPYERLDAAFDAVEAWLKEHGHEAAGPHWEVYYTDPQAEPDPTRWRTDVVRPVRPAGAG